jgi:hypothetical protein
MTGRRRAAIAALALALVIALAGDAAATPRWGVVIDRGPLRVSAEAGLDRDARRVADRAERSLTRITADLPDLPRPAVIDVRIVRDAAPLADARPGPRRAALGRRGLPTWAWWCWRSAAAASASTSTRQCELAHRAGGGAGARAGFRGFAWRHASLDAARIETWPAWWFGSGPIEAGYGFPAAEAPASRLRRKLRPWLAHRGRYAVATTATATFQDFLRESWAMAESMDRPRARSAPSAERESGRPTIAAPADRRRCSRPGCGSWPRSVDDRLVTAAARHARAVGRRRGGRRRRPDRGAGAAGRPAVGRARSARRARPRRRPRRRRSAAALDQLRRRAR